MPPTDPLVRRAQFPGPGAGAWPDHRLSLCGLQRTSRHTMCRGRFGVFLVKPEDTFAAVSSALQVGYRHIDTAENYGNEKEIGEAIGRSGLDRTEVFVTSKLSNDAHEPDDARRAFDDTLKALGFDYIDLFMIHWSLPTRYDGDYVSTWRTLEEFYREGRARSVGVSNFQPNHLRRLHAECEIPPAVDQIEVNPYLTQDEVTRVLRQASDCDRGLVAAGRRSPC
jgi:2,5-diketo-D-gluconate reductase A